MSDDPIDPTDRHVGSRLRERRGLRGYSLQELARYAAVSAEQLRRYECGVEKLPLPVLYELCHVLDVAPNYFFSGDCGFFTPQEQGAEALDKRASFAGREMQELLKVWYRIRDEDLRNHCLGYLRTMALEYDEPLEFE